MDVQDGAGSKPVFVDPTGQRSRRVQRAIWVLGVLLGCYLALVLVSLLGTPGLSRLTVPGVGPVLPGPAAPKLGTSTGTRRPPARVLPPAVSPSPRVTRAPSPAASAVARPTPAPPPPPSAAPRSASPSPSASPSGPPRATPSNAAPSAAASPARPSPRNSRAPTARPSRGPK